MAELEPIAIGPKGKDLRGQKFGLWTVLDLAGRTPAQKLLWLCRCECGIERPVPGGDLRSGQSNNCGCVRVAKTLARNAIQPRHRMKGTPEYNSWRCMIARCEDASNANYGGRGVSVCERWRNSFDNFLADMGRKPSPKHTIERKDRNGNYEPGNCVWATPQEQGRNKRTNRLLTVDGDTMPVAAWGEKTGISQYVIHERLSRGWSASEAVNTPLLRKF